MQELTEMSLKNFEGLRFPKEAVEHEVAAFIAVRGQGAHFIHPCKKCQPIELSSKRFATHHDLHLAASEAMTTCVKARRSLHSEMQDTVAIWDFESLPQHTHAVN